MRLVEDVVIDAPPERVWQIVADPADYPAVLPGVTVFDPEEPDRGPKPRARYAMRFLVGAAEVGGTVELIEYSPPCDLAWTSITGIDQRGHVRVRSAGRGRTRLELRFSYGAPGALLGTAAELASRGEVSDRVRFALETVKALAEGRPRPRHADGRNPVRTLLHEAENVRLLARSRLVAPMRPDKVGRLAVAALRWGATPAMGVIAGAIRHPDRPMLIDELGALTYAEVDRHTDAIARGLRAAGLQPGDRLGLMCRDHRGFVEAALGAAKAGADVLLLNTSFAGPQLREVADREDVAAIVYDEEFAGLLGDAGPRRLRFTAWHEGDDPPDPPLSAMLDDAAGPVRPPGRAAHITILTSGTTGTPKGASRQSIPLTLDPVAALLERIPFREGQTVLMAAPMFHAWGFANLLLGMALGSTFVLRRRFDPERCLADIEAHRCDALIVVPVMLQRILALPEDRRGHDTSSLRIVAASGSALPGDLANRWMDAFGDNLYNLYGSTEVSMATIARPRDLRAAPGTAGKPARGCVLRLYDERGRPVPQGETGRIFVGNALLFEGYTGGGSKDVIDGLMATGDVGYLDPAGRLFVQGRDDDMIVSGGENVFPKEVEDVLDDHPAVAEAACIGVDDEDFGQRLRAYVVPVGGRTPSERELQDHVKANLARYKVPREIVFVDELPRNPTGKVLKRELREREPEAR